MLAGRSVPMQVRPILATLQRPEQAQECLPYQRDGEDRAKQWRGRSCCSLPTGKSASELNSQVSHDQNARKAFPEEGKATETTPCPKGGPCHQDVETTGSYKSKALPVFCAFTGCDTSAFATRGTKIAWDT
ncbi:hypothetical protein DPX16_9699 [Anabarilius grahami]|uniref:Uncharacterized protein n=1 Tax=Anabarilius grahami TaxID=495550 RepID=A0A3N0Y3D6_ANAGA|nr:hypothetical protein DPX16_9699 [Anabarilius grahami]